MGDDSWLQTDEPPADCPAIVTVARVATEAADVLVHPAQRRLLVEQAVAAGAGALLAQLRQVQEAERAEAVVDGDEDGIGLADVLARVGVVAGAAGEAAAVDPHEHRPLGDVPGRRVAVRDVHVRVQAVLGVDLLLIAGVAAGDLHRAIAGIGKRALIRRFADEHDVYAKLEVTSRTQLSARVRRGELELLGESGP